MAIVISWVMISAVTRASERTWWSPGSFLALALCLNAIGTSIFAPEYYMSLRANLYLQALVLVTSLAAMIGHSIATDSRQPMRIEQLVMRRRKGFIFFGLAASLSSAIFTIRTTGVRWADMTSPLAIMRAAQRLTYQRYTEGLNFPLTYNISNALVLSYAAAVAVHFVALRRVEWRFTIPLIIFAASNMLITTRSPIVFMVLIMVFAAAYTSRLTSKSGQFIPLRNKNVIAIAIGITAVIGTVFFSFEILRFGEQSTRSAADVWEHLRRYPWGSLPGFSVWFDRPGQVDVDTLPGYYTFMGIYDNLGIASRQQLTYSDFISLTRSESANVYTVFRGLYHDFGVIGSGVFCFIIGLSGGVVASPNASGSYSKMSIYIAIMTFVAFAFVVSSWAYTSNIAALLVLPLILKYFSAPLSTTAHTDSARIA